FHSARERNPLVAELRLSRADRADQTVLESLPVESAFGGAMVPLGELGQFVEGTVDRSIAHKNLQRVAYVFAEVAGRAPAEVILDVQADRLPDGVEPRMGGRPVPVAERSYLANGA